MIGQYLYELLRNIINNISNAGCIVNRVISDKNVINRSTFKLLAGADSLPPCFLNHVHNSRVLFDSIHIMKCIRNSWLNLKSFGKSFTFPDPEDTTVKHKASFNTFYKLYEFEKGQQ